MNTPRMGKKTFGVYLDEDNVAIARDGVIKRDFKGNLSDFMDTLLLRAIENAPPVIEGKAEVLLELARLFHPTIKDELAATLPKGANQSRIVARMLEALLEALKRGDEFDAGKMFHLYNSLDQLTAQVTKTTPGIVLMKSLAEYLQNDGRMMAAAEDPAGASPVAMIEKETAERERAAKKQRPAGGTSKPSAPPAAKK